jgi:hypothetical protein
MFLNYFYLDFINHVFGIRFIVDFYLPFVSVLKKKKTCLQILHKSFFFLNENVAFELTVFPCLHVFIVSNNSNDAQLNF